MTPQDVLDFWFGPADPSAPHGTSRAAWWTRDDAFDKAIRERFGVPWEAACAGELDSWLGTDEGTLALVIVLDQFSRNLCREDPRAWAQDLRAVELVLEALERGVDERLPHFGRAFLYMPLMHSEDRGLQRRSLACFTKLVDLAPEPLAEGAAGNLRFAQLHKDIVDRFGRYPHRNAALGRVSTDEEREFLAGPNSSF